MTNRERYRAAFGGIRAPENAAARAEQALEAAPRRKRRPLFRTLLVAAAVLALLGGTATAELTNGAVSNLLAPLYGGAQTRIVDDIGCPVGASVSVNGYTLTADAVIGDRHNIAVVYTFTREDGQPIEGRFDEFSSNALSLSPFAGSGGGTVSTEPDPEHPNQLRIVEVHHSASPIFFRDYQVTARDLVRYDAEAKTTEVLAEGQWDLRFTLRYRDATVTLPMNGLTVTGTEGTEYQLQEILLSPMGVYIDMVAPNNHRGPDDPPVAAWPIADFKGVYLRLNDGTMIDLTHNHSGGASGALDAPTLKARFGTFFEEPIPFEEMDALVICGTEVPVR